MAVLLNKKRHPLSLFADVSIYSICGILALVTLWPLIYVFSMSISDPGEVVKGSIYFYPKGFSLDAYERLLQNSFLWRSYLNTIIYTVSGTFLNILTCSLTAYPLTRKGLFARRFWVIYLIVPMYFGGGLIPYFILVQKIGLFNNPLVMIIPNMVSIWNIILLRTFMNSLPKSIEESAVIDGANDITVLFRMLLPLSKPILAVVGLYTAVGIWNNWFSALLFLPDRNLQPLQLFLAKVLAFGSTDLLPASKDPEQLALRTKLILVNMQLKYAVIIFSTLPIILTYPFLQKYFIKGVILGSLKE